MFELPSSGSFSVQWTHRVLCCRDTFGAHGEAMAQLIAADGPTRVLAVLDEGLCTAQPELKSVVADWMAAHQPDIACVSEPMVVPGGERAKNDRGVVDSVIRSIHERGICRRSVVLAIGGGAMLDAVGLAAATAHRGVRIVRCPSTTLAQADAGVGVKNGINALGAKNLIGTFAPPLAVINDSLLLTSLSETDWRAGLSEAVKVALLKAPDLLDTIEQRSLMLRGRDLDAMEDIVNTTADLHVAHIVQGGDPFESHRARPLDFGHWSAHQLELMTGFRLSHGDAVAIGLLIDLQYGQLLRGAHSELTRRIAACFEALGFPLQCDALGDEDRLLLGIERFREHLGGQLAITLVGEPGQPAEVDVIDESLMRQAIRLVVQRGADGLARGRVG
ncbi:MAG: 3-dehydroquinate synthase [Phycisphaerales bacterium]|nr:3-dehydroquinate synthase [Phycisphaerales bacterium]